MQDLKPQKYQLANIQQSPSNHLRRNFIISLLLINQSYMELKYLLPTDTNFLDIRLREGLPLVLRICCRVPPGQAWEESVLVRPRPWEVLHPLCSSHMAWSSQKSAISFFVNWHHRHLVVSFVPFISGSNLEDLGGYWVSSKITLREPNNYARHLKEQEYKNTYSLPFYWL